MLRRGSHRRVKALALVAALLATTAPLSAAQPPGHTRAASSWRLDAEAFWTWTRLWLGFPASVGSVPLKSACEGGLSIDPDGRTVCRSQANPSRDGGLSIDPNG
jgi:hypothetical protein